MTAATQQTDEGSQPTTRDWHRWQGVPLGTGLASLFIYPSAETAFAFCATTPERPHTAPRGLTAVALLRLLLILNLLSAENNVPGQDFGLSYTSWEYRIETSIPISPRCLVNIINLVPCCTGNDSVQREESTAAAIAERGEHSSSDIKLPVGQSRQSRQI